MDKDRVEGKLKDIKGRVKRQAGEWSGDEQAQAEGAMDQAEGKVQNAVGKTKDAVRDLDKKINHDRDKKDDAA
ncbi:MAG: CsbD family protein [Acidobacteriaceae bacterium]